MHHVLLHLGLHAGKAIADKIKENQLYCGKCGKWLVGSCSQSACCKRPMCRSCADQFRHSPVCLLGCGHRFG
jgi:hypothetical protein